MTAPSDSKLTGKQRRFLRGQGHDLQPIVQLGKDNVTDTVVEAVDAALLTHELIKLKLGPGATIDRHEAGAELARRTSAELVQVLGRTLLLYRRHPEEPRIVLPD